jgi:hypothetical protein
MSSLRAITIFGSIFAVSLYVLGYEHTQSGTYHVIMKQCDDSFFCWLWTLVRAIFRPEQNAIALNCLMPFAVFLVILYLDTALQFGQSLILSIVISGVSGVLIESIGVGPIAPLYMLLIVL